MTEPGHQSHHTEAVPILKPSSPPTPTAPVTSSAAVAPVSPAAPVGGAPGPSAPSGPSGPSEAAAAVQGAAKAFLERIRNNAEVQAPRGTTTIADEVVEKVAGIAAREVTGVFELGGDAARVFSAVKEKIGLGEASAAQGVSVQLRDREAEVNVVIVVEYGHVVLEVAEEVRTNVIGSVEKMLGLQVTEVNIIVDDVHVPEDA